MTGEKIRRFIAHNVYNLDNSRNCIRAGRLTLFQAFYFIRKSLSVTLTEFKSSAKTFMVFAA